VWPGIFDPKTGVCEIKNKLLKFFKKALAMADFIDKLSSFYRRIKKEISNDVAITTG
jgi:hypothetical protein